MLIPETRGKKLPDVMPGSEGAVADQNEGKKEAWSPRTEISMTGSASESRSSEKDTK